MLFSRLSEQWFFKAWSLDLQRQQHQELGTDVHAQAHLEAYLVRVETSSLGLRSPQVVLEHTKVRTTALRQRWLPEGSRAVCRSPDSEGWSRFKDGAFWFALTRERGSLKRLKTGTVFWVPFCFCFFSPGSDAARRRGKWCQGPASPLSVSFSSGVLQP